MCFPEEKCARVDEERFLVQGEGVGILCVNEFCFVLFFFQDKDVARVSNDA